MTVRAKQVDWLPILRRTWIGSPRGVRGSGLEGETVVILTTDHGMSCPFGRFETYLDSAGSPLLIRWRRGSQTRGPSMRGALVSLCDLAPTILGLAGAEPLEAVDGKSLVRTVQGAAEKLRGHLLAFRYEEICYKSDIDRFGKDGPAYRNKLKEIGVGWATGPCGCRNDVATHGQTLYLRWSLCLSF